MPKPPRHFKRQRVPNAILDKTAAAIQSANMERAHFGDQWVIYCYPDGTPLKGVVPVTMDTLIKDKTRLYRETWITARLEVVMRWMKGETP